MSTRRSFIQHSAALVGGLAIARNANTFFEVAKTRPAGLQLFTLFTTIDSDVAGSLKKVAGIGYKEIESAFSKKGGFYGMKASEFGKLVKDQGMSWKSHHVLGAPFKMPADAKPMLDSNGQPIVFPPIRNLKDNMQELVDEVAAAGVPFMVCASTPIGTLDEVKASIDVLAKTGEACKKAGIGFAYHNHDKEFVALEGQVPYDMMLSQLSPDEVKFELDLCWVTKAGVDPVDLFTRHPGRFPLWHVKDLDKAMTGPQPVGTGIVDFKRIFDNADKAGMKHFFVEHDMPADAFASITTSFQNLKKMKLV
ncbi:MAG: sugar phosphate isomerase/epimerase [Chitinophagaceae bacterium]|nr:MAG: sugar phosphate isomerase/epimerase [Chitinophagaceae bacterium]